MELIPINEFSPHKHYVSQIASSLILPRDKEIIDHFLYSITQAESYFILPLAGEAVITLNNSKIHLTPGTLTYVPPFQTVLYSESVDFKYLRTAYCINDIKTNEPIIFSHTPMQLLSGAPKEIQEAMNKIHSYCPTATTYAELQAVSAFYKLLAKISNNMYSTENTNEIMPKIYAVIKYMNINFQRNDTTKVLADMAGLSEPYFRKCFKKATNMSPIEYRNYLRIEEAKKNITFNSTYHTSEYVAHHSGFDDTHYFQKLFKKYTGVTPRQYFKRHFSADLANTTGKKNR